VKCLTTFVDTGVFAMIPIPLVLHSGTDSKVNKIHVAFKVALNCSLCYPRRQSV